MRLIPFLVLADFLMIWLCGYGSLQFLSEGLGRSNLEFSQSKQLLLLLASIAYPLFVRVYGGYERRSNVAWTRSAQRALTAWASTFSLMLIVLWANKISDVYSRLWLGLWFCGASVVLGAAQVLVYLFIRWLHGAIGSELQVLLIGSDDHAMAVIRDINMDTYNGYHITGYFGDYRENSMAPQLGRADEVWSVIPKMHADEFDEIWIMQSEASRDMGRALFMRENLRLYQLRFIPSFQGFEFFGSNLERVGRHSLIGMTVSPQVGIQGMAKRVIDIVGALLGLMLLMPLLLGIAVAIKRESTGGVFFSQNRHGRAGKTFRMWKFRSMYQETTESGFRQAVPGDERVTNMGRWLRCWSLDELPQLWNVLKGDMSLVGPRPHVEVMNQEGVARDFRYQLRHKVKPGMSGWAQVHGYRGATSDPELLDKRLEFDLHYIHHWTLWLDIKILFMTIFVGFRNRNAY